MFKSLILILCGLLVGYFIGKPTSVAADTQVTYNSVGHKVVVATSDSSRNATIAVGKECGESGYSLIGTGEEKQGEEKSWVVSVECTEDQHFNISNLFGK
jgi:hypothetical protein